MKAKHLITTLAAAFLAGAAVFSLRAEEFTSTYTTTQCADYDFITQMLIGPGVARRPTGAKISQTSSVQVGVFSNLVASLESVSAFTNGVILSTGSISDGSSTKNESVMYPWAEQALPDLGTDKDLNAYFGEELADPAGIILYLQPTNRTINIPFIMASEEFYAVSENTPAVELPTLDDYKQYSDKFAFFLKELGDASDKSLYDSKGNIIDDGSSMTNRLGKYINIAQLPEGGDVEIATVNQHTNTQYFISNVVSNEQGKLVFPAVDINLPMEFNGAIVGPVAVVKGLDTNKVYKLKIILGDSYDNTVNSAVFLRERGITSGADLKIDVTGPNVIAEGGTATFVIKVSNIGPATADGVVVTNFLPLNVASSLVIDTQNVGIVDNTHFGNIGGTNYLYWTLGDGFAPGSNATLKVSLQIQKAGVYTNIAHVVTSTGDYDESNNRDQCATMVGALSRLRVSAISTNKVYGAAWELPDLAHILAIEGTNDTEIVSGITVSYTNTLGQAFTKADLQKAPVGTYGIVLSAISGFDCTRFGSRITYVPGVLEITKADLTITADDRMKMYGTQLDMRGTAFTYAPTSLPNGDTITTVTITSAKAADPDTDVGEYPGAIEAGHPVTGIDTNNYNITFKSGKLIVAKRKVALTSATDEKVYDGIALTNHTVTVSGDGFYGREGATYDVTGRQLDVGSSTNTFTYTLNEGTKADNYTITTTNGILTVTKNTQPITITAATESRMYDGTILTNATYSCTAGVLASCDILTAVVEGGITNVGDVANRVTSYEVVRTNDNKTVTGNYTFATPVAGTLTITPRAVTLTSASAAKEYDGAPLVTNKVTVTGDGFITGEGATYTVTGSQTDVGSSANTFSYELTNTTKADNYTVSTVNGTLTVTANTQAITITADSANKVYDGTPLTTNTYTYTQGILAAGDTLTAVVEGTITDAGTADNVVTSYQVMRGADDVTAYYTFADSQKGSLTVTKRPVTLTSATASKQYDGTALTAPTASVTSGSFADGEGVESCSVTGSQTDVGSSKNTFASYTLKSNTKADNYTITTAEGTLTVSELDPLTLQAASATKVYDGTPLTTNGYELVAGALVSGDVLVVTVEGTITDVGTANNVVTAHKVMRGTVDVTKNYTFNDSLPGTLTVTPRSVTVTADDKTKMYGETVTFAGTEFKTEGLLEGATITNVMLTSDGAAATAAYKSEGYPIVPSDAQGEGLDNYTIAYVNGTLTFEKLALEITALNGEKNYGEPYPFVGDEFTITAGALLDGDSVDSVTLTSDGAAATAAAGSYAIVPSAAQGTGLDGYTITYKDGTLTVKKLALTLTANDRTKTYGEEVTFAGTEFTVTAGTLLAGDSIASVTLTSDGAAANAPYTAAGYPIVPSNAQGTGLDNYAITYANGLLTLEQRKITITADDRTKTYGETVTFAGTEFKVTSGALMAGDAVTSVTLVSDGAAANAPYTAAGYPIVPSAAQGTGLANYAITYANGLLTLEQRKITITADDRTKTYGEAVTFAGTEFKVTSGSLMTGDTVTSVTLTSDGAAATAPYKAEGYPIVASAAQGTGLANYAITYANGTLTLEKLALEITALNGEKNYGEPYPFVGDEFTITAGSLAAGDRVDSVTLVSDGAAATAPYKAGGYPIVPSNAQGTGLDNYTITYKDGTLTVKKLALTLTANDRTKTYGEEVTFAGTEFTVTAGTLLAGDSIASVTLTSDGAAANAPYTAAGYPIVPSNAQGTGLDNYAITYANGLLTLEQRKITITADDRTKTYGETVTFAGTEFKVTSGSLMAGDAVTSVTLVSDGAAANAPYTAAGYPIVPSAAQGTGLANYAITYANGLLTLEQRKITITADDRTKTYGEAVTFAGTEFKVTSGSLLAGDAVTSVTLTSDGAAATAAYKAEGYPIVPSAAQGTGLANYAITYANGTLTLRMPITIIANDVTRCYGEVTTFKGTEFTVSGEMIPGEQVATVTLTSEKAADEDTDVGIYKEAIVPSYAVTGIDPDDYVIAFSNGTLTVTQAVLTISVNDARWKAGKARPDYSFADFSAGLKAGDTVADVTGGMGASSDVTYTNRVWNTAEPTKADAGTYADEIWIDVTSLDGAKAGNYLIAIDPGDLTVAATEAELKTAIAATLNWNTGLLDLTLTVTNAGDGEVDPDYDYWVELLPGPAGTGAKTSVARTYYLAGTVGTMPDGYNYQDLTAQVKAALKKVGNKDDVFDPGESVTVTGVSVYHWKRWAPGKFIDADTFLVAGQLFNVADTDKNFAVSDAEKIAAAALLGTSSADYLEVTRLALLPYYHWKASEGTWK